MCVCVALDSSYHTTPPTNQSNCVSFSSGCSHVALIMVCLKQTSVPFCLFPYLSVSFCKKWLDAVLELLSVDFHSFFEKKPVHCAMLHSLLCVSASPQQSLFDSTTCSSHELIWWSLSLRTKHNALFSMVSHQWRAKVIVAIYYDDDDVQMLLFQKDWL